MSVTDLRKRSRPSEGLLRRVCAGTTSFQPVFQALPPYAGDIPMPPAAEHAAVLDAIERYRETSPQMIVFSSILREALPERATNPTACRPMSFLRQRREPSLEWLLLIPGMAGIYPFGHRISLLHLLHRRRS